MTAIDPAARLADGFLTDALMRHVETLLDAEPDAAAGSFVAVVYEGLMSDTCACHPYPPSGHTYPTAEVEQ